MSVVYTCDCPGYTFYVTINTIMVEVHPLNFLETMLVDEPEQGQLFYRRKFTGELMFGGKLLKADYTYFNNLEQTTPCARIDLVIYKGTDIYWSGYFSTAQGKWDHDQCTFTVTPLPEDDYTDLLTDGDVEHNILTGLSAVTTIYDDGVTLINYDNSRVFYDAIEYLADQIIPGIVVASHFFNDATNYVTKLTNHYNHITISQKSDVKYPDATNPAWFGMLSFNSIMDICKCMNLAWDYRMEAGVMTLRIEHISWWPHGSGWDIRTQKITRGTNKYSYTNEKLPKYEYFRWMEADNTDFVGAPIYYNSVCVNQDPKSNKTEMDFKVTTDIEYIIESMARELDPNEQEGLVANEGWVLFANRLATDYYILFGTGPMGGTHFNIDLSWSRLHEAFFKHDRQLMTGVMNNNPTTFYSAKKIRQQECTMINCYEFVPDEYITTELGETYLGGAKAYVKRASHHPDGKVDLSLLYGYAENANPGLDDDKTLVITEELTGATETTYTVTLNQIEAVDLTISIWITCVDGTGGTCDTVPVDVVITAGNLQGVSAPIAWCAPPTPPPVCLGQRHKSIAPLIGWVGDFIFDLDIICP